LPREVYSIGVTPELAGISTGNSYLQDGIFIMEIKGEGRVSFNGYVNLLRGMLRVFQSAPA
jgi:hypothetical protein